MFVDNDDFKSVIRDGSSNRPEDIEFLSDGNVVVSDAIKGLLIVNLKEGTTRAVRKIQ